MVLKMIHGLKTNSRGIILLLFILAILGVCCGAEAGDGADSNGLPTIDLKIGSKTLTAEIASTSEERRVGLMNRKSMPEDHGMIFVFDPPEKVNFWMKNTYIPLSAAFISEDGIVVKKADMEPLSEKHYSPDVPVQFVIEVNQGWFKTAGLRVGSRIKPDLDEIMEAAEK